jgi:NADH-quinone oxidoreductase subunit C
LDETLKSIGELIAAAAGEAVREWHVAFHELNVTVTRETIVPFAKYLRDEPRLGFVCLIDVCGVDWPERPERFDVVYHLLSPAQNVRIRVKLATDEDTPVPSISDVFPGADWFEREAYDLYGILFTGHPDLRRILTDYGFDGYPLRKDFPLTGFVEVRYDDERKRVVYEPVRLAQEFRSFDFLSPWEGMTPDLPGHALPGDEKATLAGPIPAPGTPPGPAPASPGAKT